VEGRVQLSSVCSPFLFSSSLSFLLKFSVVGFCGFWVSESESEISVVIFLYSLLLISGFLLLFSPVDVGHID